MRVFVYESQTPVPVASTYRLSNSIDNSNIYIVSDELSEEEVTKRMQNFSGTDDIFVIPQQLSDDRQFMLWLRKLFGHKEVAIETADEKIANFVSEQAKQDAKLSKTGIIVTGELVKKIIPTKPTEAATGSNSVPDKNPTPNDNTREVNMSEELKKIEEQKIAGLQKFLDDITSSDVGHVDAILIARVTSTLKPFLFQSVNPNTPHAIDVGSYGNQIGTLEELRKQLDPTGSAGKLGKIAFLWENGSTTIVSKFGNERKINVFFIGTGKCCAAGVDWAFDTYATAIKDHLQKLGLID